MRQFIIMLTLVSTLSLYAKDSSFPIIAYTKENHKLDIRYSLMTDIIFCFLKPTEKGELIVAKTSG